VMHPAGFCHEAAMFDVRIMKCRGRME
jgi:hypothetical protein